MALHRSSPGDRRNNDDVKILDGNLVAYYRYTYCIREVTHLCPYRGVPLSRGTVLNVFFFCLGEGGGGEINGEERVCLLLSLPNCYWSSNDNSNVVFSPS